MASCSTDFPESVNKVIACANSVYADFLKTEEGRGFNGQVAIIADSMGSVLAHDALCRSTRHNIDLDQFDGRLDNCELDATRLLTAPASRRKSSSTCEFKLPKFDFDVGDFFIFGSPLSIILAARRLTDPNNSSTKPHCTQVYNLFHPTDPVASRLEPLLSARFSMLAPVNIPRYAKYPLGNGQPYHLCKSLPYASSPIKF